MGYLSRFSTISLLPLSIAINKGVLLNANQILFKKKRLKMGLNDDFGMRLNMTNFKLDVKNLLQMKLITIVLRISLNYYIKN